ncbi:MAG TPA: hopanoid biosynthesis associated radical SAM protein HpnJ, partial [Roseiarcus sp.]|nr:hopanoid biosynthesis associated radical SAM protein HpnJ [Roseiarcus sp.]
VQMAPPPYPGLSQAEIFDSFGTFFRSFYPRPGKIASIVGEMVLSPEMMKRRLRDGAEFFRFLRKRRATAQ